MRRSMLCYLAATCAEVARTFRNLTRSSLGLRELPGYMVFQLQGGQRMFSRVETGLIQPLGVCNLDVFSLAAGKLSSRRMHDPHSRGQCLSDVLQAALPELHAREKLNAYTRHSHFNNTTCTKTNCSYFPEPWGSPKMEPPDSKAPVV